MRRIPALAAFSVDRRGKTMRIATIDVLSRGIAPSAGPRLLLLDEATWALDRDDRASPERRGRAAGARRGGL
jgi:hypothetical protein